MTRYLLESNRKLIRSAEKALVVAKKTSFQKSGVWNARAILSVDAKSPKRSSTADYSRNVGFSSVF